MPHHSETRFLPYAPAQLFELVADIERYPEFLPWCKAARVTARSREQVKADLVIGNRLFSEKFTSLVALDRPRRIAVQYVAGPLSHLTNEWIFEPAPGGCDLSFEVGFDFRSPLLRAAMEMLFDKALVKMVAAFEARAKQLYGTEAA